MDGDRSTAGDAEAQRPGIQSVETAAQILSALARLGAPAKLSELAHASGMPAGKIHRYLVSLVRSGLAEQVAETGRYAIGPLSISAGLAGLSQLDPVRLSAEALAEVRDAIGETAAFAVWSERGPTVIRFEESERPVTMNVRIGSALPLTRSAIGLVFLAHMPARIAGPVLATETGRAQLDPKADADTLTQLEAVREAGVAGVEGLLLPGANALAAPVFDHTGRIAGAIGVVGFAASLDVSPAGAPADALLARCADLSARLGYRPE